MKNFVRNLIFQFSEINPLTRLRHKLDAIEITDRATAEWICNHIPARCPFERRIYWFSNSFSIPPLCKLNPFYRELVALRLRATTYLMNEIDEVGEYSESFLRS
ncbi:Mo-dependent nitrogenase C-terminal domain-containing protein [Thermocoleostomius sinensis]|uniref:Nitrogenase n=1 Tax=Thermocoleostomius sinensis A174 TaxID=2016057 RepID=A0A9E8ZCT3_9CYAN|nr:Mo-dependent nitrogenase C-terminal domain-containing protein [Thermocoleostomius sinensis]WAL60880.1 nitrogenase [Thermocoleostomius sinensis A174]